MRRQKSPLPLLMCVVTCLAGPGCKDNGSLGPDLGNVADSQAEEGAAWDQAGIDDAPGTGEPGPDYWPAQLEHGPADLPLDSGPGGDLAPAEGSIPDMGQDSGIGATTEWVISAGGTEIDEVMQIHADSQGNVLVTGRFKGSVPFGSTTLKATGSRDIYVAKISTGGSWQWAVSVPGSSTAPFVDKSGGLDLDSTGNEYLTGRFSNVAAFGTTSLTAKGYDLFVAKVSSSGSFLWVTSVGGASSAFEGEEIAVAASGEITVAGELTGDATFGSTKIYSAGIVSSYLARASSSGAFLWASAAPTSSGNQQDITGLGLDSSGNAYISGYFSGTATFGTSVLTATGTNTAFVVKADPSGKFLWARQESGSSNSRATDLAVDGSGNVLVTGRFAGTAGFGTTKLTAQGSSELFVARMDPSGQFSWVLGSYGPWGSSAEAVDVDAKGNVLVSGVVGDQAVIGTKTLKVPTTTDLFVASVDPGGKVLWLTLAGGPSAGIKKSMDVATSATGHIYMAGEYAGTLGIGGKTMVSVGDYDIYVWKLAPPP